MKNLIKFSVFIGTMLMFVVIGCDDSPSAQVVAKYTNEQALAIIDSGWKISYAIVVSAVIRAIFNSR